MRTVFTVAAGLVATTSAANLRSKNTVDKADMMTIQSLAEKYDCATGGDGLENVISKIAQENSDTTTKLTATCDKSLTDLGKVKDTAITNAGAAYNLVVEDAGKARGKLIGDATKLHNELISKHELIVTDLTVAAATAASDLTDATDAHKLQTLQYNEEVTSLAEDREASKDAYWADSKQSAADLKKGIADADFTRNEEVANAKGIKSDADTECNDDYSARKQTVQADNQIIEKLEALERQLTSLNGRAKPKGEAAYEEQPTDATSFVELRVKAQANYEELLKSKQTEIGEFNAACDRAFATHEKHLTAQNERATNIKVNTNQIRDNEYAEKKSNGEGTGFDQVLDVVVKRHESDVETKTATASAKQSAWDGTNAIFIEKEAAWTDETGAVTAERLSTKAAAQDERDRIDGVKRGTIKKSKADQTATIADAQADKDGDNAVCLAALNKRLSFLAADDNVIAQLEPLLAKLGACSGAATDDQSLLEVSAGCALNDKKLETVFLQQQALPHGAITGSFGDWKNRLFKEKKDASDIRDTCDAAALAAFTDLKDAADKLATDQIDTATTTASDETTDVNQKEGLDMTALQDRWDAVQDPYDIATSNNKFALGELTAANTAQADAETLQATKVSEATEVHRKKEETADGVRNAAIAADIARAESIEDVAAAAKERRDTAKKSECDSEDATLNDELAKLQQVVDRLGDLQVAGEGLDMESQGTIEADIKYLKSKVADEITNSATDNGNCLVNSETALAEATDGEKGANTIYNKIEEKLIFVNSEEVKAIEATKTAGFNSHNQREETNEDTNKRSTAAFSGATQRDAGAKSALSGAKQVQSDFVGPSAIALATTTKQALAAEELKEETALDNQKETVNNAVSTFTTDTETKTEECKSEHSILQEERDVLEAVRAKVATLQVVGQGNNYDSDVKTQKI